MSALMWAIWLVIMMMVVSTGAAYFAYVDGGDAFGALFVIAVGASILFVFPFVASFHTIGYEVADNTEHFDSEWMVQGDRDECDMSFDDNKESDCYVSGLGLLSPIIVGWMILGVNFKVASHMAQLKYST